MVDTSLRQAAHDALCPTYRLCDGGLGTYPLCASISSTEMETLTVPTVQPLRGQPED